jgi:hypothetical protein
VHYWAPGVSLLPGSYACEAGQFTLAACLEPSGDIAGDTFDFAMERDTLHLSMTDAMGRAVNASVLATVLVGGLRNAWGAGVWLGEQARLANVGLGDYAGWSQFVTARVARIDLRTQPRRSSMPVIRRRRCDCATVASSA